VIIGLVHMIGHGLAAAEYIAFLIVGSAAKVKQMLFEQKPSCRTPNLV